MGIFCGKKLPPLRTVESVDVNKFAGSWYVVGVIPTPFEKGANNPVEKYTVVDGNKTIKVDFTYNKGSLDGPVKSIPQILYPDKMPIASGKLKASPFWPVKLPYLIMELSEDYENIMVGYPSRAYLWIMSRSPNMDQTVYDSYVKIAEDQHYDVSKIIKPPHA